MQVCQLLRHNNTNRSSRLSQQMVSWIPVVHPALEMEDIIRQIFGWMPQKNNMIVCATVSKAWLHPAQELIFRSVALQGYGESDKLTVLKLLLHALDLSPHLASLILRLDMCMSLLVLDRIASLELTSLLACTVNCWIEQVDEMRTAIPLVQKILRRTTLLSIRFHGHFFSPGVLDEILDGCSTNLIRVDLSTTKLTNWDVASVRAIADKIKIHHLSFGSHICPWLARVNSPLDLSRVRSLRIKDSSALSGIELPLDGIVSLNIMTFSQILPSTMQLFSALSRLFVVVWPHDLHALSNALTSLPLDNQLVELNISTFLKVPQDEASFRRFDSQIGACDVLRRLQRVNIQPIPAEGHISPDEMSMARACFHHIGNRFILTVDLEAPKGHDIHGEGNSW
ncbi:hypothetical protein B0H11DRAFT_1909903 [Mycena galericulata]|nr:hypothetical protein B0H11DRAFT_1909903 [Mycena galericulata]